MSETIRYGLDNSHPLFNRKTELVWEGKYDEYGRRREVDIAGCAMPLQKIETIDEPLSRATAQGELDLFRKERTRIQEGSARAPRAVFGALAEDSGSAASPGGVELSGEAPERAREARALPEEFRNRLIWGDNKLVMASLLAQFKGLHRPHLHRPAVRCRRGFHDGCADRRREGDRG
ncbi:MAG: hypothetical protein ACR2OZ_09730 [Verrucomicrobiales bacterium]